MGKTLARRRARRRARREQAARERLKREGAPDAPSRSSMAAQLLGAGAGAAGVAPARVPKSFVFLSGGSAGRTNAALAPLRDDIRRVMLPFTADRLRERRSNALRDFAAVAGPLGVSHFLLLSTTAVGTYLRIARFPNGPTLTFRVHHYALARDVGAFLPRPFDSRIAFDRPAVVMLQSFPRGPGTPAHLALVQTMLRGMFPSVDVANTQPQECRRVAFFAYSTATDRIEFRHYGVVLGRRVANPALRSLVADRAGKQAPPSLRDLRDVGEFVLGHAGADSAAAGAAAPGAAGAEGADSASTDSAARSAAAASAADDTAERAEPESADAGGIAVRLVEIGPRLRLQLVKVEVGMCEGAVQYHAFVVKTPQEQMELEERTRNRKAQIVIPDDLDDDKDGDSSGAGSSSESESS